MTARSEWGSMISDFSKEINQLVAKERDELATVALKAVVEHSPVAQGVFVLNNIVSIGSPDFTADESHRASLGEASGLLEDDSGMRDEVARSEALAQGKRKINKRKRIYTEIYIQNNVSYVDQVENTGWHFTEPYETYQKASDDLERYLATTQ